MRRRSGYGWFELIIGIMLVVLGIFTFIRPGSTLTGIVILYGLVAVITGISDLIFYVRTERYTGFGPAVSLISGIFSIMAGVMLLVYPKAGAMVLTLLFPIWFIAHCISRLAHQPHVRRIAGSGMHTLTLIINIIGLILGFMMLLSPLFTLATLRNFAGIYLILLGIDSILMSASRMGMRR